MGTVLLILLGILILVYLWLKRHYNYWARQGIPQPPPVFGFGCFLDVILMRDIPGLIYDKMYKDYSGHDAVGLYQFFTPELLLRSPELIKRVMASDFSSFHDNLVTVSERLDPHFAKDPFMAKGEEWKRYRAKLVPTVTSTRMKEIYPLMKDVTNRLDAYLEGSESKIFDAKELATLFTMDNVSSTVFGINSNCFSDPEATFRKLGNLQMKEQLKFRWQTIVVLFLPRLRNLLGLRFVPTVVNNFVESIVQDVIDFRNKNGVVRNDLFQYFMKKEPGNKLEDIMSYAMTFFIEGFETAAMTASAAIYELALNPDVQVTLHEEILEAFGDEGNIDVDVAYNLPYLDKVVQELVKLTNNMVVVIPDLGVPQRFESLRKYPIMYVYDRECTKAINFDVDGKSVEIPVGCSVVIPVYSIHHDPQYYPDPEVFDPERFSKENKAQRPAYTYMPFGEGPRICPGLRFGLTQVKLLLTYLVHKYKIQRCDKTPEKLTLSASPVLVSPNEQQWIRLEKRW